MAIGFGWWLFYLAVMDEPSLVRGFRCGLAWRVWASERAGGVAGYDDSGAVRFGDPVDGVRCAGLAAAV